MVDVVGGEGGTPIEAAPGEPGPSGMGGSSAGKNDVTYQCLFCNHIFKSHYCYQKHKRRHLNPFTVDFTITRQEHQQQPPDQPKRPTPAAATAKPVVSASPATSSGGGKIVKDINVQFFPCKICGAKFPSYYFVHKHKKIWHADHIDVEGQGPAKPTASTSSAGSASAISGTTLSQPIAISLCWITCTL